MSIIGRPNVGKSALFNAIVGRRLSIVDDSPGITRDFVTKTITHDDVEFTIIDTGGIEIYANEESKSAKFIKEIKLQAEEALEISDLLILTTDIKTGLTNEDFEISKMIRKSKKQFIVASNKNDNFNSTVSEFYDLYKLGTDKIYKVSAIHKLGISGLLDGIVSLLPKAENIANKCIDQKAFINIGIVGRPNVGKSSLVNKIIDKKRLIVSDISGTTRDSIYVPFKYNEKYYNLIDTAGMRKHAKVNDSVDYYSTLRAKAAIAASDVVLLVIDATVGVDEQDTKIAGLIHEQNKASLVVLNKWDLIDKTILSWDSICEKIKSKLAFMKYIEIVSISALTGQRVFKIFEKIDEIIFEYNKRITTSELNNFLLDVVCKHQAPAKKGKRLKLFYITEVSIAPPTFVLFVNNKELAHFSYVRYIENNLRESFGFKGTPIRIILRNKGEKDT